MMAVNVPATVFATNSHIMTPGVDTFNRRLTRFELCLIVLLIEYILSLIVDIFNVFVINYTAIGIPLLCVISIVNLITESSIVSLVSAVYKVAFLATAAYYVMQVDCIPISIIINSVIILLMIISELAIAIDRERTQRKIPKTTSSSFDFDDK